MGPEGGSALLGVRESAPLRLRRATLAAAWLALPPAVSIALLAIAPSWTGLSERLSMLVATAVAAALPIVAIALARRVGLHVAVSIALAVVGAAGLGSLALHGWTSRSLLPVALGAQLAAATGVGSLVGFRVQHPGHILPAAAIAAACDVLSVLHPMGASRAIAESASALPILAAGAPVPGTTGMTFALGVGDLTFAALLFAVVVRHGLAWAPLLGAVLMGIAASLALSGVFAVPIPALVAIGALAVLVVPAFRDVRRTDRTATRVALIVALAVVVGVALRTLLGHDGTW